MPRVCFVFALALAQALPQPRVRADLERLSKEAGAALAGGHFDAAAKAYEALVKLDPAVAENYAQLGLARYMQGEFSPAVAAFEKALQLKPALPGVHTLRAMSLSELGRYAEAEPALEKGFEHPPDPGMRRLIGLELERSYRGLHQLEKAAAIALRLSRLYPDDPELMYHAGRLYGDLAYDTMHRLATLAPDSVWVHQAAGEAYEVRGQYDLAVAEYRAVLKLDPARPGIHFRIGRVFLSRSDDPDAAGALQEFEKELEIDPTDAGAAYEIGEIQRKNSRLDQARLSFARAVREQPEFEEARIGLARVLIELHQPREALAHLNAAIAQNPDNEVSQYQLAMVYKALGNAADQQKAMDRFRALRARRKSARNALIEAQPQSGNVTRQTLDAGAN